MLILGRKNEIFAHSEIAKFLTLCKFRSELIFTCRSPAALAGEDRKTNMQLGVMLGEVAYRSVYVLWVDLTDIRGKTMI